MDDSGKIIVIGSGNVATHIARALDKQAHVAQICSKNISHAQALASQLTDCEAIDALSQIDDDARYYIIAVSDDSVADVAAQMPRVSGTVAHTSGSVPMQALSGVSPNVGVFYPLQTFSKNAAVDVAQVPFFIEGSTPEATDALAELARGISRKVGFADSNQRAVLHIAAVFACNFTNHLWSIADGILKDAGYDFDVFKPLLQATTDKAFAMSPAKAQTGPAARGDMRIINEHLSHLQGTEKEIYRLLSQSIISKNNSSNSSNK